MEHGTGQDIAFADKLDFSLGFQKGADKPTCSERNTADFFDFRTVLCPSSLAATVASGSQLVTVPAESTLAVVRAYVDATVSAFTVAQLPVKDGWNE